jgi:hypothetical protein
VDGEDDTGGDSEWMKCYCTFRDTTREKVANRKELDKRGRMLECASFIGLY